jgi:hypothetical protein
MKTSFEKLLQREIDTIMADTGANTEEAFYALRKLHSGVNRERVVKNLIDARFELLFLGERFRGGEKQTLLEAIKSCIDRDNFPFPDWVRGELYSGVNGYLRHKSRTLDGAFAITRPKGYHPKAIRKMQKLAVKVYVRCEEMHAEGIPFDDGMFESAGEEFGIGKTTAKGFYYKAKKEWELIVKNPYSIYVKCKEYLDTGMTEEKAYQKTGKDMMIPKGTVKYIYQFIDLVKFLLASPDVTIKQ